jgi:hypothetical protein
MARTFDRRSLLLMLAPIAAGVVAGLSVVTTLLPLALVAGAVVAVPILLMVLTRWQTLFALVVAAVMLVTPTLRWPISPLKALAIIVFACVIVTLIRVSGTRRMFPWVWTLLSLPVIAGICSWQGTRSLLRAETPLMIVVGTSWLAVLVARTRPRTLWLGIEALVWLSVACAVFAVVQRITGTWPVIDSLS